MNYNPSPKSEFVKNADIVANHHRLVEDPGLQHALQVAFQEMSRRIANNTPPDNMGACASGHLRMLGAQDLIEVFLNLAETPMVESKKDNTNLPGNVRQMPQVKKN